MARLVLDPACVLSAWEQMGGCAFSSDDVHVDDPAAITLDLSSWEARLKPATPAPVSAPLETNIFASLFNPAEFGLSFIPSCCGVPLVPASAAAGAGGTGCPGLTAGDSAAQVVPHCPTTSVGGGVCSPDDCATGSLADTTLLGSGASHFDDDGVLSLQFSDMEAAMLSASPTSSCEAGVVPDFQGSPCSNHHYHQQPQQQHCSSGATATSPPPQLPGSFFVPVGGGPEATTWCSQGGAATGGCGVALCKQEDVAIAGELGPQQAIPPQQPMATESGADLGACAPGGTRAAVAPQQVSQPNKQPQQAAAPPPAPLATRGSAASAATASAQTGAQGAQGGAAPYARTRAECLERYRQKKARRMYTKKIRYQLRKINADKRPRIKGRFVKKEELEEFLAAQRGSKRAAAADDGDDLYFGEGLMESDEE